MPHYRHGTFANALRTYLLNQAKASYLRASAFAIQPAWLHSIYSTGVLLTNADVETTAHLICNCSTLKENATNEVIINSYLKPILNEDYKRTVYALITSRMNQFLKSTNYTQLYRCSNKMAFIPESEAILLKFKNRSNKLIIYPIPKLSFFKNVFLPNI